MNKNSRKKYVATIISSVVLAIVAAIFSSSIIFYAAYIVLLCGNCALFLNENAPKVIESKPIAEVIHTEDSLFSSKR